MRGPKLFFLTVGGGLAAVVAVLVLAVSAERASPPHAAPTPQATSDAQDTYTTSPMVTPVAQRTVPVGTVTIAHGSMFSVHGTINLPEGTEIALTIGKPQLADAQDRLAQGEPACDPDCTPFTADATVHNGQFTANPFTYREAEIQPVNYPVTIVIKANQPENVASIIGDAGQNITGAGVHHQMMPNGEVAMTTITTTFNNER